MALLRPINGLDRMSDAKLAQKTSFVIAQMSKQAVFANASPTMAELTAALDDFTDACKAASTRDTNKINEKNAKKAALVDLMHLEIYFVLFAAQGNIIIANLSGFSFAKLSPSPSGPITKPGDLRVENSNQQGQMKTGIGKVKGAVAYLFQYTTDPNLKEESWVSETSTKTKCTIIGLTPGVTYYWRVAAVGTNNQIMFSDVISRMAV